MIFCNSLYFVIPPGKFEYLLVSAVPKYKLIFKLKAQSKLLAENQSITFCKEISVLSEVLTACLSVGGGKTM